MATQLGYDATTDEDNPNGSGAFSPKMMELDEPAWIETYIRNKVRNGKQLFPGLAWFALKCYGVSCSASACEHSWSIEGWIHSKRRNKLSQKTVEMLVRGHTNLGLEKALKNAEMNVLPWDSELTIDEPKYYDSD